MAEERLLPNLKTRLTLDSTEIAKGAQVSDQLRSSLARTGEGARAGGEQIKAGLITPLRAAGDVASLFAAKKIFDFTKAGFDEMREADVVARQTTNTLANIGPAAGISADEVGELSEAMLRQSGVDDELAASAANTALRLGVEGDAVRRVVQDANDLSQSFGDITSDSELLAKALAHPEQAARLLKPAIGGLTAEQQESIKAFQAQGDVAGAQNVIFEAVESRVKGAAAAYGDSLSGAQDRARESGKNLSAELVSGAAPALRLVAGGTQFLTDTIAGLPGPAKQVIGTLAILGTGTASLVRPVGDVVRLYEQWRNRSTEVAGAVSTLAAVETEEAAASAAGAASTAAATATTVASTAATNEAAIAAARRAVTNEQLTFTEAEVLAANEAARMAELQRIVSNDALIAAEEARIATETASAAATEGSAAASSGMVGVLGPLGIALAAAGIGYALLSAREDEGTDRAKAMASAISQLSGDLGNLAAGGSSVIGALRASADALAASADGGDLFRDSLTAAGLTTGTFAEKVLEGRGAVASYVLALRDSGQLGDAQTVVLLHQAEAMDKTADAAIKADVAQGKLNQADVDAAEAKSKNSDGSVNYAKALDLLQPKIHDAEITHRDATGAAIDHKLSIDELRSSTDELTDAEKEELEQADAAAKAHEDFAGFLGELASAMDRTYSSTTDASRSAVDYQAKIDDLTETIKKNSFTLDANTDKGRDNITAALDAGDSIAKLIEQKFQETHSVQAATDAGKVYVDNLRGQLQQAGFTEEQVQSLIETMHLTPEEIDTTFSNNAIEQQIVVQKYIKELDNIDPVKQTEIEALIAQGKFDEANAALNALGQGRTVDFSVNVHGSGQITITNTATGQSFSEIDISARNVVHRARGGPAVAGEPYWVGDKFGMAGAELFVPDQSGYIYPEAPHGMSAGLDVAALAEELAKYRGMSVTFNGPTDAQEAVHELDWFQLTTLGV